MYNTTLTAPLDLWFTSNLCWYFQMQLDLRSYPESGIRYQQDSSFRKIYRFRSLFWAGRLPNA
jgi:hypothetical protein